MRRFYRVSETRIVPDHRPRDVYPGPPVARCPLLFRGFLAIAGRPSNSMQHECNVEQVPRLFTGLIPDGDKRASSRNGSRGFLTGRGMAARSRRMAERRFPVRIKIAVPDGGFGERLNQIQEWLDQNTGADGWAMTPSGTRGVIAMLSRTISATLIDRANTVRLHLGGNDGPKQSTCGWFAW